MFVSADSPGTLVVLLLMVGVFGTWWATVADRYAGMLADALVQWETRAGEPSLPDPFAPCLLWRAVRGGPFESPASRSLSLGGGLLLMALGYGFFERWGLSISWLAT